MKFHKLVISLILFLLILVFSGYTVAKDVSFTSDSAASGDAVTVSINVDNLSGIAGCDIIVSYDPTVLTALYSSAGVDAPFGLFVGNVLDPNGPGTVSLNIAGAMALTDTGPGELATVTFDILPNANINNSLTFTSISLKNESGAEIAGTTFGIGAAAGGSSGSGGGGGGGGGGGCFINTSLSKYSMTLALVMVLLSILFIASALVRNRRKERQRENQKI